MCLPEERTNMIAEHIIVGEGTDFPLKGVLTLPDDSSRPVPGVVLVQGSGSTDRDSKVYKVTPFKDIAEGLAQRGIASIRYDKRTFAHARKFLKQEQPFTVFDESMEDAILAANILRADPRIGKVFIFGHSQGGMLAGRIDAEGGDFDGLIIAAGSTRNLRTILADQTNEITQRQKGPLKWIAARFFGWMLSKFDRMDTLDLEESKKLKMMGGTTGYYFKDMEAHPPSRYLKGIEKPVYVFQGAEDFQVRVEKDFAGFVELLAENPHATLKVYPGLNHVFTDSHAHGTIKDYKVAKKVDAGMLDDVAAWIHAVADDADSASAIETPEREKEGRS